MRDFPGGPVVKHLPSSAGDTGLIPSSTEDTGLIPELRSHMPQGS